MKRILDIICENTDRAVGLVSAGIGMAAIAAALLLGRGDLVILAGMCALLSWAAFTAEK